MDQKGNEMTEGPHESQPIHAPIIDSDNLNLVFGTHMVGRMNQLTLVIYPLISIHMLGHVLYLCPTINNCQKYLNK